MNIIVNRYRHPLDSIFRLRMATFYNYLLGGNKISKFNLARKLMQGNYYKTLTQVQ